MNLNESFTIKNGIYKSKDGKEYKIVYIDPHESESTYQFKDKIKNDFGAMWIGQMKTWGWFVRKGEEENLYNNKIKPCLEYLDSVRTIGDGLGNEKIIKIIDELLNQIQNRPDNIEAVEKNDRAISKNELTNRVKDFKQELLDCVNNDEFQKKLEPLIKMRMAQGHHVSLHNTILILIQDPEATFVKSKGFWNKNNRIITENAIPISLMGFSGAKKSKSEIEKITSDFLKSRGVKNKNELSVGDREILDINLRGSDNPYFYSYVAYDVRFTKQMEGKEDAIGSEVELPWYTEGEESDEIKKYIDCVKDMISDHGIKLGYSDKLGGARGVSKSGSIDILKDSKNEIGMLNTLIHEFSHELLHQKFLSSKNPSLIDMFQGKDNGRSVVEQQAELCAWLVLKYLGFTLETSINYVATWGLDKNNAADIFDSITYVADYIYKEIKIRTENSLNENKLLGNTLTGKELAKMFGMGELYDVSSKKRNGEKIEAINENFYKLFNKIM